MPHSEEIGVENTAQRFLGEGPTGMAWREEPLDDKRSISDSVKNIRSQHIVKAKSNAELVSPAMVSYIIRTATERDAQAIVDLIVELAEYEKLADQVRITAEQLINNGLRPGSEPWFHANVAALVDPQGENEVVGYTIYFFKHDILRGSSIVYMEDLYVQPAYRGRGIGLALWRSVATHGLQERCSSLNFAVLSWNQPSIDFYKKMGATNITEDDGVRAFRFSREAIEKLATTRH